MGVRPAILNVISVLVKTSIEIWHQSGSVKRDLRRKALLWVSGILPSYCCVFLFQIADILQLKEPLVVNMS